LVRHFAGDAISPEKIDCVEQIRLHLLAQLRQRNRAGVALPSAPVLDNFLPLSTGSGRLIHLSRVVGAATATESVSPRIVSIFAGDFSARPAEEVVIG
jgi:hypothetical protein